MKRVTEMRGEARGRGRRGAIRDALVLGLAVLILAASGCARGLDISFSSQPDPPRTGENTFEVTVRDADGTPVTDADVSVVFYMPAMPEMNMAEMETTAQLQHEAAGRYRGTGQVMMGGGWDVTVIVERGGEELGRQMFSVTAQ